MTCLLQTHSYTVITKALHTFKTKHFYMILSKKVSCYNLPAVVSCRLKIFLSPLSHYFVLQLTVFLHHQQYHEVPKLNPVFKVKIFSCLYFGHLKKKSQESSSFPAPLLQHPVASQGPTLGAGRKRSLTYMTLHSLQLQVDVKPGFGVP